LENQILEMALKQGPWATSFLILLFYVMKQNEKREDRLTDIIDKYADKLNSIDDRVANVEDKVEMIVNKI
jgi:hypothetical protein